MATYNNIKKIKIGDNIFNLYDSGNSGGTITSVTTTAGAHTVVNVTSGAVSFNVPTTAAHVGAVPTTRKVNNKALSSDITLSASDVSAVDKTNPLYDLDTSAASGDDADLYTALSNLGWNNSSYGIITS